MKEHIPQTQPWAPKGNPYGEDKLDPKSSEHHMRDALARMTKKEAVSIKK